MHLAAAGGATRDAVAASLHWAGVELVGSWSEDAVLVAAARTVDEALDGCPATGRPAGARLLLVADTFTRAGVRRAVGVGAVAMMQSSEASPDRLLAAVRCAYHGEGRLPQGVLTRLLGGADAERPTHRRTAASPLTARQTTVLSLVAEGHDNAAIARTLDCSQHTVKNVIYDLMGRLQVHNRAHAVAHAVRAGLI
ncbi:LuxR C-terminal-related transcriptional regulator [Streptomyces sp. NPDC092296]|uniref:response regulator transcription factor n=1 Tax=Streptomyces sp. NPDC092296 TaxID=3366012 RepID=UPI0038179C63